MNRSWIASMPFSVMATQHKTMALKLGVGILEQSRRLAF
jgi:hypothetical protein